MPEASDAGATSSSELQRLGLEELLEPEGAELAADARLLVATERRDRVEPSAVDVDLTGLHPAGERGRPLLGLRPDRTREAVGRAVGDRQGLVLVGVADHRQDWAEDLLLLDRHAWTHVGEDGWSDEVAGRQRRLDG